MVRRITPSQYKSKLRQLQSKQKQAINNYNRAVDKYNRNVKQAVSKYNQEVRTHNARVRANHQRLKSELNKLSKTRTTKYTIYHKSTISLSNSYEILDQRSKTGHIDEKYNHFLDLSEQEAANSIEVMNSLLSSNDESDFLDLQRTSISDELALISPDLHDRWIGALFSLNPRNPDASRHFCASSREVINQILELKAPDTEVIRLIPDCSRTQEDKPTRRAKIKYLLHNRELEDSDFEDFIEDDIQNVIDLFQIFNDGTHGSAGKFNLTQLTSIKRRVEGSIVFLSQLAN